MAFKIAYLGPQGTFTEEATLKYVAQQNKPAQLIACKHIAQAIGLLKKREVDEVMVPIENSYGGQVQATWDELAQSKDIKILRAINLKVEHYLLVRPGVKMEEITTLFSHPQAFSQCYNFITKNLPGASLQEMPSTAEGAAQVAASQQPWGAIGAQKLAEQYGLQALCQVNDSSQNTTRFWVLGLEEAPYCAAAKTSIIVSTKDNPGSLFDILREFAYANINLTKIESRPTKKKLGDALFFIDFLGHHREQVIARVLASIKDKAREMILLGSYPYDHDPQNLPRQLAYLNSIPEIRKDIDIIDRQIIELLSKRVELVGKLSGLKGSVTNVRDREREKEVISRLRHIAAEKGVDPQFVEDLYRIIIDHCVRLQICSLTNSE